MYRLGEIVTLIAQLSLVRTKLSCYSSRHDRPVQCDDDVTACFTVCNKNSTRQGCARGNCRTLISMLPSISDCSHCYEDNCNRESCVQGKVDTYHPEEKENGLYLRVHNKTKYKLLWAKDQTDWNQHTKKLNLIKDAVFTTEFSNNPWLRDFSPEPEVITIPMLGRSSKGDGGGANQSFNWTYGLAENSTYGFVENSTYFAENLTEKMSNLEKFLLYFLLFTLLLLYLFTLCTLCCWKWFCCSEKSTQGITYDPAYENKARKECLSKIAGLTEIFDDISCSNCRVQTVSEYRNDKGAFERKEKARHLFDKHRDLFDRENGQPTAQHRVSGELSSEISLGVDKANLDQKSSSVNIAYSDQNLLCVDKANLHQNSRRPPAPSCNKSVRYFIIPGVYLPKISQARGSNKCNNDGHIQNYLNCERATSSSNECSGSSQCDHADDVIEDSDLVVRYKHHDCGEHNISYES